jgi:hypothetical protein
MNESHFIANQLLAIIMPLTRSVAAELRHGEKNLNPAHLGALAMLTERACNLSELAEYQGVAISILPSRRSTRSSAAIPSNI